MPVKGVAANGSVMAFAVKLFQEIRTVNSPATSNAPVGIAASSRFGLVTLAKFLGGDRQAIITIASSRLAFWIGALFVLAAGFAREYDGESLWDVPWHLAIPLGASLVAATTLYLLVCVTAAIRQQPPVRFFPGWYRFVGLFWMTAPIAFLYAVPYERLFTEVAAVQANLWTLALVALWRVALMARVIQVVFHWYPVSSGIITVLFANVVAVIVAVSVEFPVSFIAVMGGVRYTATENLLSAVGMMIQLTSFGLLPFVLVAALGMCISRHKLKPLLTELNQPVETSPLLLATACAALLIWLPVLPVTQREQQLRYQVEIRMMSGRIDEGLAILGKHSPDEFPPHWSPPPHVVYPVVRPPLKEVLLALARMDPPLHAAWEDVFALKARSAFGLFNLLELSQNDLEAYTCWLERVPLGPKIATRQLLWIGDAMEISESHQSYLDRIRAVAKQAQPKHPMDDWAD